MKTSLISPLHICFFRAMLVADGGWGMFPKQCSRARKTGNHGQLASGGISFGEALPFTYNGADDELCHTYLTFGEKMA